jgi:UDP-N-acetylmuramoylalanine--D-glutamate ligase
MDRLKGKRIAIIGLSTEGQDAIKFFLSEGIDIVGADRRDKETLFAAYPELNKLSVPLVCGSSYLSSIDSADIIVRTPGMSLSTPEFIIARENGKEITSVTKLFFELCKAPIIGVTGTKGKGTTSTLIYEMLKKGGKTAYLGGNVGTPLLSVVKQIQSTDWVVLELSSFQLEDLTQSPHIAVVLSITQEHLANYDPLATNFHRTRDAYVEAKKNIIMHQKKEDYAIFHADDPTSCAFAKYTKAVTYFYGTNPNAQALIENDEVCLTLSGKKTSIATVSTMQLLGRHNLENIAAAALAASVIGIPESVIHTVAENFKGLPLRLENVGEKEGILYINDSFSTTPESTISAIASFTQPIILILGGSEKGADFTEMGRKIAESTVKKVIVVGDMTERITKTLKDGGFQGETVIGLTAMHDMVKEAKKSAITGDVILLSPACASFGLFKNYKERGKQFTYEVSLL